MRMAVLLDPYNPQFLHAAVDGDLRYGEATGLRLFRKFGVRYSELHPCAEEVKMAYVGVRTMKNWLAPPHPCPITKSRLAAPECWGSPATN